MTTRKRGRDEMMDTGEVGDENLNISNQEKRYRRGVEEQTEEVRVRELQFEVETLQGELENLQYRHRQCTLTNERLSRETYARRSQESALRDSCTADVARALHLQGERALELIQALNQVMSNPNATRDDVMRRVNALWGLFSR